MVNPAQIGNPKDPKDVLPTLKVLENLAPPVKTPVSPQIESPLPATESILSSPTRQGPLSLDEIIPAPYELRQILSTSSYWLGGILLAASFWVLILQMLAKTPTRLPLIDMDAEWASNVQTPLNTPAVVRPAAVKTPVPTPTSTGGVTRAPRATAPVPDAVQKPSAAVVEKTGRVPENLTARFMSPSMIELNWNFVGDDYRYQLYSSLNESMTEALPETDSGIVNPRLAWQPKRAGESMWLAVTSIDPQGQESSMSSPLAVRLPPEF